MLKKTGQKRRWSKAVTDTSDAMDIPDGTFKAESPRTIAKAVKRSAERSRRRKGTPRQSAMSMLNFYINRAGKNLSAHRRSILKRAKQHLRSLFDHAAHAGRTP